MRDRVEAEMRVYIWCDGAAVVPPSDDSGLLMAETPLAAV